jgi:neopullulanase
VRMPWALVLHIAMLPLVAAPAAAGADPASFRERLPEDEIVYFLLPDRFENGDSANDRGGLEGDRLATGFDPASSDFYQGGDLQGLRERLDYVQSLGATAIWLGPVFRNKPVQGPAGRETAGYHGYWITDFTAVDPHFGSTEDLRALVEAAQARGLKVYLDIITNHTADVIRYRECPEGNCPYRSLADYPYSTRGDVAGEPINAGFLGHGPARQDDANFARLTRPDFAYTPFVPTGEETIKVPAWLNDPIWYHNRGDSLWAGESTTLGDFAGLDDLMTENPRVVRGFIEIYGDWIDRLGVDGFRIDTAKHVNDEFWQAFAPAMLARAAARGIPNFHLFGEVWTDRLEDTALLARFTRRAGLPSVIDFGFAAALRETVAGDAPTARLSRLFADDALYAGGEAAALRLPTFISNHDDGRFAWFVQRKRPGIDREETLQRVALAHAMLLTLRGVPTLYYGDEQGFVGTGGFGASRQSLFPSQVAEYNATPLLGTAATTADANFDTAHPLYRLIAELATLRRGHAALRRGPQRVRAQDEDGPGLFAVSRFDPDTGREYLVAFNTSTAPLSAQVQVEPGWLRFESLRGACSPEVTAPGSLRVSLPPLGHVVCVAEVPR